MENFKLNTGKGDITIRKDLFDKKLTIEINSFTSMSVDRGNGEEEDITYDCAAIMLDKKQLKELRKVLDDYAIELNNIGREEKQ